MSVHVAMLRRLTGAMTIRSPAGDMIRSTAKSKMKQGKKAMKAAKAKADAQEREDSKHMDGRMKPFEAVIMADGLKRWERSQEEKDQDMAIAKKYTTMMWFEHRRWQKEVTRKIKLREYAIQALPEDLKAECTQEDEELFPEERHIWTDHPPKPGFMLDFDPAHAPDLEEQLAKKAAYEEKEAQLKAAQEAKQAALDRALAKKKD